MLFRNLGILNSDLILTADTEKFEFVMLFRNLGIHNNDFKFNYTH